MKLSKKMIVRGALVFLGVGIISSIGSENPNNKNSEKRAGEVAGAVVASLNDNQVTPTSTSQITPTPSATMTIKATVTAIPTFTSTPIKPTATPKPTPQKINTPTPTSNPAPQVSCKYQCSGADVINCDDFSSQQEAQAYFNCCGHTATNDPMGLDDRGVGNGLACDGYKY